MQKLEQTKSHIPMSRAAFRKEAMAAGASKKEADLMYREASQQETWANDLYLVQINRNTDHGFGKESLPDGMFELTIRRQDRGPMHDWRHVQLIKNQLVGEDNEMVELYPAESRLRDSANQYWYYGFNNDQIRFPFGMMGRYVDDDPSKGVGKSKQRKIEA